MMARTPAAGLRTVFIDTSAFYALTDPGDANHSTALAIRDRLIAQQWRLFTTNFVLAETHALLLSRLGRLTALTVLQELDRSSLAVVRVSRVDEARARAILIQYEDKDFSLTDALSFAVMERLGLAVAFSFDQHFLQYGFEALKA